ncbi:hypothetical protein ACH4NC_07580 [Streptomyces sp. NPDC017201]|uniref:hypothetical protein n=1 Tax=Streptomyces sp. NPDC017201 TaxID=3364980 RepID=UPI00378B6B34
MILRRYHRPPDVDDDQADEHQAVDEQTKNAPQASKPAGRSAAPSKAKKNDGG